ncbi:MAG: hypothetical protein ACFFCV_04290 [Promethearchaeota archaeon]
MVSKRNKYIIGLVVLIVISVIMALIASNIIAFNVCGTEDPICTSRIIFQWFFPAMVLSFLALAGCLGLALLIQA